MAVSQTSSALFSCETSRSITGALRCGVSTAGRQGIRLKSALSCRGVGISAPSRRLGVQNGSRVNAWFKFGGNGVNSTDAGIYGSQTRDDFDKDDVEQYFNYMGMLATEGTYDKMDALLNQGIHPVDILLLMASSEGDQPKVEELLKAGARSNITNLEGKTALDIAATDAVRELIASSSIASV